MADLSKVIDALRCCVDGERDCDGCPYERGMDESCITDVMADALELLEGIPRTCGSCMYVGVGGDMDPCRDCVVKGDEPPTKWRWKYEG